MSFHLVAYVLDSDSCHCSYKRSTSLNYSLRFCSLPRSAWKYAELEGNIVHSPTYAPITSRDKSQKIVSLELLQMLADEHEKVQSGGDVQLWLAHKEKEHQSRLEVMVCKLSPAFPSLSTMSSLLRIRLYLNCGTSAVARSEARSSTVSVRSGKICMYLQMFLLLI